MFTSLKSLLNFRLGAAKISDELIVQHQHFLLVDQNDLYNVIDFLKHDPDTHLNYLQNISYFKSLKIDWPTMKIAETHNIGLFYQLFSTRLPYEVMVCTYLNDPHTPLQSITQIFQSASWIEKDLQKLYDLSFE